jgi:hypothetical protein
VNADALLTGRELVEALAALDVGIWTPASVRQWIREEPPCPIAAPAQQGAPHRYRLDQVLPWLRDRTQRERVKGFTAADGGSFLARLEAAMVRASAGAGGAGGEWPSQASEAAAQPARAAGAAPVEQLPLAPAVSAGQVTSPGRMAGDFNEDEVANLNELDLALQVLRGRDPRNWESVERAIKLHRENRKAATLLVPVDELDSTLKVQALAMRNASTAMVYPLAQRIPDNSTLAQRVEIIREVVEAMLTRLSREDTEVLAGEPTP